MLIQNLSAQPIFFQRSLFLKRKIYRAQNERKAYEVLPMQRLFQIQHGEKTEDDKRHYFLDNF
jgi:hypothetical protein